jgi:CheY-like chemotaxis protein
VDRALLKVRCSPGKLCVVIDDIFAGRASGPDSAELLAAAQPGTLQKPPSTLPPTLGSSIPASKPPSSAQPSSPNLPSTALSPTRPPEPPAQTKPEPKMNEEELRAKTRQDFVKNGPDVCNSLKSLLASLLAAKNESERSLRLQNFYRKVHFITATSGLAECLEIAHLATVFEALLFDLMPKPGLFQPSTIRTITQGVELLTTLYGRTQEGRVPGSSRAQVLVVDDDAVCNRLVVSALRTAQLHARSVENPHLALEYLKEHPYDMILLDVDMPGMDGFETCRRLRQLPGYEKTPVVYVTGHADFMHREQSIASGAEDLIGKPIVPLELALKVVMHLLRKS